MPASSPSCREQCSQTGQVSCGHQISVDEIVKRGFESMPCDSQGAATRHFLWKPGIEDAKARREHSTVGLGEEHRNATPNHGELVPARVRDLDDESLADQTPEVIEPILGFRGVQY